MAVQIILKNSSVEDKRPTANQLTNGEVSLNYHEDGAFLCCRDTDGNIQQIGGIKISNDAPGTPVKGTLWLQPNTSTLFVHNGSSWLAIGGGGGGGGGGAIDRIVAGDGIDIAPATGVGVVTVNADIDTERGLEFVAGEIAVKLGAGLTFNTLTGAIDAAASALAYKGTIDLTTAGDVPANPTVGDTYANVGSGAFDSDWVTATGEAPGTLADPGDLVVWNGTVWTFIPTGTPGGGGGVTNLSYTPTTGGTLSQGGTVVSDTGTDADIPMAGHSDASVLGGAAQAGLMSPGDKTKLDSIETDFIGFTDGRALTWDDTTSPDTLNADIATEAALGVVQVGTGLDVTAEGVVSVDGSEITTGIDLGYTAAANEGTVTNSAGDNATVPFATSALAGLFIEGATPAAGAGTAQYVRQVTEAGVATWETAPSGGGASVNVGEDAPADPDEGDLWYDTDCDVLKVFDDTDTWVESAVTMPTGGDTADDCREKVFYENEQQVDFSYTLSADTNAMSAGPITIADGVDVNVPDGQTWTIVGGTDGGGGGDFTGFWQRSGTTLSPITAGDNVDLGTGDLSANEVHVGETPANPGIPGATLGDGSFSLPFRNEAFGPIVDVGTVQTGYKYCRLGAGSSHASVIDVETADNAFFFRGTKNGSKIIIENNGTTKIGGTLPGSPNITLNANGSGTFKNELSVARNGSDDSCLAVFDTSDGNPPTPSNRTFQVLNDGAVKIGGDGSINYYAISLDINGVNNSDKFLVRGDGQIFATSDVIAKLGGSERRLKENISLVDANKAWETIKSVPYYAYNYIGKEATLYGPMVDEVPADMVIETDQSDDEGVIRTYDNVMLQARLYTALQTALTRIEALEAEVQSLKEAN